VATARATLSNSMMTTRCASPASYDFVALPRTRKRPPHKIQQKIPRGATTTAKRKAMTRLWAKREEQIHGVVETMAGLYGDLQGIAGRSLQEIAGLEVPLLDGPPASEAAE
jgi:hypothetical protein